MTNSVTDEEFSDFARNLSSLLGVRCCKSMNFGFTIMDTNIAAGRDTEILHEKHQLDWSPQNALMVYPEIEEIENTNNVKQSLAMSCAVVNGFAPYIRGITPDSSMSRQAMNFMEGRSLSTTNQSMKARHDAYLEVLFSHLSWYGAKNTIISSSDSKEIEETIEKLTKRGYICSAWKKAPPQIRYVVRLEKDKSEKNSDVEYVYFVGGSEDVIGDNLEEIPNTIFNLYCQIKTLKEESKKGSPRKASSETSLTCREDPKNLWYVFNGNSAEPLVNAHLLAKKMLRIIESVFFIRNYFVYASKNLVVTVDEVQYDKKTKAPIYKQVDIQKVIEKYDMIYAYCKNLCYMYSDIAKGDVV
jgi:hypothetical protein